MSNSREWLVDKWVNDITTHNRYYDPTTLLVNVELAVAALTDKEVEDYVNTLKAYKSDSL